MTGECWIPPKKDTPRPRAKKKPQQDGRRDKIALESNLLLVRDAWRTQNLVHARPRDSTEIEPDMPLSV